MPDFETDRQTPQQHAGTAAQAANIGKKIAGAVAKQAIKRGSQALLAGTGVGLSGVAALEALEALRNPQKEAKKIALYILAGCAPFLIVILIIVVIIASIFDSGGTSGTQSNQTTNQTPCSNTTSNTTSNQTGNNSANQTTDNGNTDSSSDNTTHSIKHQDNTTDTNASSNNSPDTSSNTTGNTNTTTNITTASPTPCPTPTPCPNSTANQTANTTNDSSNTSANSTTNQTNPCQPNSSDCGNSTYKRDIAQNPLHKNFGDPQCNFNIPDLESEMNSLDPVRAAKWMIVLKSESSLDPNRYAPVSQDGGGAWGLFQMGSVIKANNALDHGDVPWNYNQPQNAIGYLQQYNKNNPYAYWCGWRGDFPGGDGEGHVNTYKVPC